MSEGRAAASKLPALGRQAARRLRLRLRTCNDCLTVVMAGRERSCRCRELHCLGDVTLCSDLFKQEAPWVGLGHI
jgi:hypothetical protein